MFKKGPRTKAWEKTRREYLKANPPNFEGYYTCSVCGKWITNPDIDHIQKRGSHPELMTDFNNLRIICRECHHKLT